jgi:hypothetical protein
MTEKDADRLMELA